MRNGYTVKILNKLHEPRAFSLAVRGLEDARLTILGMEEGAPIQVATDDLRELRVFVSVPAAGLATLGARQHGVHRSSSAMWHRDMRPRAATQFQKACRDHEIVMRTRALPAARISGLRGHHVLAGFLAFFGVVLAVNGAMIYSAISTHTGLVAIEPYRKGLLLQ